MVRQAPVICVMAPPIHLGAWSMALMLRLPFELLLLFYDFYCSLPSPRSALQVRLFLYCELRLLEMFRGDGYASSTEPGSVHCLGYLCPNMQLSELDEGSLAVLPMTNVTIPD